MAIKRERLIHPLSVAVFGGAIGLSGALLLSQEGLVERVKTEPPNALSIAYLEAWIRIRHDDVELRSLLASQYIRAGRLTEAQPLVAALLAANNPALAASTIQLQMDLTEQKLWALNVEDSQRPVLIAELDALLKRSIKFQWPAATLKVLAIRAHVLDQPALSAQFFALLARQDPNNNEKWREVSANWALADGRYRDAADAAFERQKAAPTLALQREYFLRGMSILESGNLLYLAMKELPERITPALQQDPQTLRVLIRMARSANRPDLASDYAQRLLQSPKAAAVENISVMPEADMQRPAMRVTDYEPTRPASWVYLDGPRGNALRAQLDAESSSRTGRMQAGIVRVADVVPAVASEKSAKPTTKAAAKIVEPTAADANDYELAYNAFLSDQKLEQALDVVERALKRSPNNIVWMKRSAVINEWAGRPAIAMQAWLSLARRTDSQEAWQAVERLSTGLHDDVIYIESLRHRIGKSSDELLFVDQIVATYERLGEPEKALTFLQGQIAKSSYQRELLERYAALAERFGEDKLALKTWLQLNRQFGPRSDYALKIAAIYNVEEEFDLALKVMVAAEGQTSPNNYLYWHTLWSIAARTGRDDIARVAARNLIGSKDLSNNDLSAMVGLWDAYPLDAGRIAEKSFHRTGNIASLQQAIYEYSRARAWPRINALLAQLTPEQTAEAEKSPELLMAKAEFLRQTGRNDAALETLRTAIALDDSASDARAAFIWELVDRGSDAELRSTLERWRADAEDDAQLWGPYAAGYMRLSKEAASLHFFHKEQPTKYQDPLWALTYAEALESFGHPDQAWTVRQLAWEKISRHRETLLGRKRVAAIPAAADAENGGVSESDAEAILEQDINRAELRSQAATLSQSYAGGDFSRALLLQILREDSVKSDTVIPTTLPELDIPESDHAGQPDAAASGISAPSQIIAEDVALAWSISNEPYELARQWMAQRYGAELERPAYAEVAVALAMDDRKALQDLIERNPDRIPVNSLIEANMRLDRWSAAQRVAFNAVDGNPDNEELFTSVRELGLLNANYIGSGFKNFRQSPLNFTERDLDGGLRLSDRWSLTAKALSRDQHSTASSILVNVPKHDRAVVAGLGWKDSDASVLFEAGNREAVENFTQARIQAAWHQQRALSWTAEIGYNQEATDTAELRIGGVKDSASLAGLWRIGTREFAGANVESSRYYDQDRRAVGSGNQIELEIGYNLRLEYPDFTIRGVFTRANYKAIGTDAGPIFGNLSPDAVAISQEIMPSDFTQKGLLFSFGTDLMTNYTHAWRPFMEAGYLYDSRRGWGSTGRVGFAGSVFGNDHATLYYEHERSAQSVDGGAPSNEFGVRYRWYF